MQDADFKWGAWRRAFSESGDELVGIRTGIWMVVDILRFLYYRGIPDAIVLRYLNDREHFLRAFRVALGEWASILVALALRIRIIWICHNVDRETIAWHPRLSGTRRWLVSRVASRIFVTDPLLVEYARHHLPSFVTPKLDWLTFGEYRVTNNNPKCDKIIREINLFATAFRAKAESEGRRSLIGLCLGAPGWKYAHFEYAEKLLATAAATPYRIGLIVGGDFADKATQAQLRAFQALSRHPDVFFTSRYVHIDERASGDMFDFFWRGYRDQSMSYTLYVAASVEKPVLALDCGFVATAVRAYCLGAVVDTELTDVPHALELLAAWNTESARNFLRSHRWDIGAARLREACSGT